MPNWDEIRNEWEATKITFKLLAEKHGVKLGTLKSRRSREGWSRDAPKKDATIQRDASTKDEKDATVKKSDVKRKAQRNRSGNPSPSHRFPNHNSYQLKHGLYSKFLHKEQVEIIEVMKDSDFIDQLWMQIEIKFSAILRMQKIMGVDNEWDHLKEESGHSQGMEGDSISYKVVYAHERYESYIKAQTRAMAEYRNLVKQYIELTDEFDERRMKLEGMQANIDKTKADTEFAKERAEKLKGTKKDTGLLDALVAGRQQYEQLKGRENDE